MEHFYRNIPGWFDFEQLYCKVISELPNKSHIVEVINSGKSIKIDAVDTWTGSTDIIKNIYEIDPQMISNNGNILELFKSNLKSVIDYVTPIQLNSTEAAKLYEDKSLDFVFLDAGHDYSHVKEDILAWLPKIKDGGIIGGHDYKHPCLPGVTEAVDEFFKDKLETINGGITPDWPSPSWLVRL
jgi:hypothetical protein